MKDEEKDAERRVNNVTMDTLFQPPITINKKNKDSNVKYERRIASGILVETIK